MQALPRNATARNFQERGSHFITVRLRSRNIRFPPRSRTGTYLARGTGALQPTLHVPRVDPHVITAATLRPFRSAIIYHSDEVRISLALYLFVVRICGVCKFAVGTAFVPVLRDSPENDRAEAVWRI
jgi:hypothetical protein